MQTRLIAAIGLVTVVAATNPTLAQDAPSVPTSVLEAVDFGGSLARIQRRLNRLPDSEDARGSLPLDYYVRVYAKAPRLERFRGFDLHNSPVPYGAPMHDEMLQVIRGTQLYPPSANLNAVMGWAWKALR